MIEYALFTGEKFERESLEGEGLGVPYTYKYPERYSLPRHQIRAGIRYPF